MTKRNAAPQLTADEVALIIERHPGNVEKGKTAEDIKYWYLESDIFTLKTIPVDSVRPVLMPARYAKSFTKGPIIVENNWRSIGYNDEWGLPKTVVIDGQHRWAEAYRRGDKTIDAYVGDSVRLKKHEGYSPLKSNPAGQETPIKIAKGPEAGLIGMAETIPDVQSPTGKIVKLKVKGKGAPMYLSFGERSDWNADAIPLTEREIEDNMKVLSKAKINRLYNPETGTEFEVQRHTIG